MFSSRGAKEIKDHPFLRDLDFDNLLSQQPPYPPPLDSDVDTGFFETIRSQDLDSEEDDTSDDIDWLESQNFVSSSQRLSNLYTTNNRMVDNEDHKSSSDYSQEISTKHSDVEKESSSSGTDSNNQCSTADNKSSSVEEKTKSEEKQKPETVKEREPRRRSIFRWIISFARRLLSRAAQSIRESWLFSLSHRGTLDISKTESLITQCPE
ncbi:uncharacterized protein ACNLHF_022768 [Anomaloglossus baeobatrachus]